MNWEVLLLRLAIASVELTIIAVVVTAGIRLLKVRSAQVRSFLWLLVLLKPLLTLLGITLISLTTVASVGEALPLGGVSPAAVETGAPSGSARTWAEWLMFCWLSGVAVFLLYTVRDRILLRKIMRRTVPLRGDADAIYRSVARELRLPRAPRALSTSDLDSPAVVGCLRPVILIPSWLECRENEVPLQWAFKHELMHFKSRDALQGLVRQITQTLFFFHPVAWWSGARWEEAKEMACDRSLVRGHGEARLYAEVLFGIAEQVQSRRPLVNGLYATRTQIGSRIRALLKDPPLLPLSKRSVALVMAFTFVTLGLGIAQVATPPAPEADGTVLGDPKEKDPERKQLKMLCVTQLRPRGGNRELQIKSDGKKLLEHRFFMAGEEPDLDPCAREMIATLLNCINGEPAMECCLVISTGSSSLPAMAGL